MGKTGGIAVYVLAGLVLAACAGEPAALPQPKPGTVSGPRLELRLEPGPHYAKDMKVLWIEYTVWPQVAAWVETPDGRFLGHSYVTELAVTGNYRAAPKQGRPRPCRCGLPGNPPERTRFHPPPPSVPRWSTATAWRPASPREPT
ncbi:MAG: hypothetical protein MZU95_15585 [Desulfomicrobium escambiense]|nr:hypothetical protein [Desulfomicrobium escambiense]